MKKKDLAVELQPIEPIKNSYPNIKIGNREFKFTPFYDGITFNQQKIARQFMLDIAGGVDKIKEVAKNKGEVEIDFDYDFKVAILAMLYIPIEDEFFIPSKYKEICELFSNLKSQDWMDELIENFIDLRLSTIAKDFRMLMATQGQQSQLIQVN